MFSIFFKQGKRKGRHPAPNTSSVSTQILLGNRNLINICSQWTNCSLETWNQENNHFLHHRHGQIITQCWCDIWHSHNRAKYILYNSCSISLWLCRNKDETCLETRQIKKIVLLHQSETAHWWKLSYTIKALFCRAEAPVPEWLSRGGISVTGCFVCTWSFAQIPLLLCKVATSPTQVLKSKLGIISYQKEEKRQWFNKRWLNKYLSSVLQWWLYRLELLYGRGLELHRQSLAFGYRAAPASHPNHLCDIKTIQTPLTTWLSGLMLQYLLGSCLHGNTAPTAWATAAHNYYYSWWLRWLGLTL